MRIGYAVLGILLFVPPGFAQGAQKFQGKWSGYWDSRWPMSIDVTEVKGNKAQVTYTHPEGQNAGPATISGNTLTYGRIVLTLTGANAGRAVGSFSTATRQADVTRN